MVDVSFLRVRVRVRTPRRGLVGRLWSRMRVSTSFQIIPRPVGRLGLGLGSGVRTPRHVALYRLAHAHDGGSRWKCPTPCKKEGNCPGGRMSGGICPGGRSRGNVLHSDDQCLLIRPSVIMPLNLPSWARSEVSCARNRLILVISRLSDISCTNTHLHTVSQKTRQL